MTKRSFAAAAAAMMLLLTTVSGQQPQSAPASAPDMVQGEVLVKFSRSLDAAQRDDVLRGRNASRIRRFGALDIDHVRLPPGANVNAVVNVLRQVSGVMAVQPNFRRHAIRTSSPNDPFFVNGSLWGLQKIQAPGAWSGYSVGSPAVIVANIDTGVDYTHPDLAPNMWVNPFEIPGNGIDDDGNGYVDDIHGIDTANGDSDPWDDQGHGTHTIGTIAAAGNNGVGVVGVTWSSRVLSCKFLDAAGSGTDSGAIECFNYIVALRNRGENIRATSNSWGARRSGGAPSSVLQAAIDGAGDAGIVNVFGAGNSGTNNDAQPFDPASYPSPSIIAVASSNANDGRSFFTNYGGSSVDLAAPGENIVSTYPGGGYESASGTSMAAPHVAGAVALLAAMDPALSPAAIKQLLLDNVDRVGSWNGRVVSGGRLNVLKAATAVGAVSPNAKPQVSIVNPHDGATFKAPVTIGIEATASDSDGIVQYVIFYANGVPIGSDTSSPYGLAWTPAPGSYLLTAVAVDDRGASDSSGVVRVTVLDNEPPVVELTSPAQGDVFTSPATVTLRAAATDPDGTVASVTFFANGTPVGTVSSAPYVFVWSPALGSYTIVAKASDNLGAIGSSVPVSIVVSPIPGRLNVARATNGGTATASSILGPKYPPAGAIDGDRRGLNWGAGGGWNDGTQNKYPDWLEVSFAGLRLIEEVNVFSMQDTYSSPLEPTPAMTFASFGLRAFEVQYWTGASWATVPGGVVTNNNLVWRRVTFAPLETTKIRVWVTAALNGYSRVMEAEAWGVNAAGNAKPEVAITSPANGARLVAPPALTIEASASDSDGVVERVEFRVNGVPIGLATVAPWQVTWNSPTFGDHVLTAVATDNQGATATSALVAISVVAANVPPTVSVTAPADGSTFIVGTGVTVSAAATDSDGSVASVAFFANGAPIGTDTTAPFTANWTPLTPGPYTLTAVATDDVGATTTSAPIAIGVLPDPNRTNVALASNGGVASASSTLNANYPASAAINGDRRGLNWGAGGGWNDATQNAGPDWLEVTFNGPKTIDEVNVFSMQDNFSSPSDPTPTMTFTSWGVRAFEVQYWTGAAWATVPNGSIANNNLVWRQVLFQAVTTTRIRVLITQALNGYSRLMEVEAWGAAGPGNTPPVVSVIAPIDGALFTAPAAIAIEAAASDADGTIATVEFFANGQPIGTAMSAPFTMNWTGMAAGSYAITAVATDNLGLTTTSAPVTIEVAEQPPPPRVNVALASNGGVATASSTLSANYPAAAVVNGDRRGLNWGAGGGWNDGTLNSGPDWLEVQFNGTKTIDEVNVFSVQDAFSSPSEPTPTMTFLSFGLRAFEVQYWTGTAWATIPGASVVNNNLVWRQFTFAPIETTRIRVFITGALNGYARATEVEAWGR